MTEEVNTGGLHRFVYPKEKLTEEQEGEVKKRWGNPKRNLPYDWANRVGYKRKESFWNIVPWILILLALGFLAWWLVYLP